MFFLLNGNFSQFDNKIIFGIFIYFVQKRIDEILKVYRLLYTFESKYLRKKGDSFVASISTPNRIAQNIQDDITEISKIIIDDRIISNLSRVRDYYSDLNGGVCSELKDYSSIKKYTNLIKFIFLSF